jgi:DNA repair ATPase RecN
LSIPEDMQTLREQIQRLEVAEKALADFRGDLQAGGERYFRQAFRIEDLEARLQAAEGALRAYASFDDVIETFSDARREDYETLRAALFAAARETQS